MAFTAFECFLEGRSSQAFPNPNPNPNPNLNPDPNRNSNPNPDPDSNHNPHPNLYIYGSLSWHWFLVDFCYFSNFACVWGIVGAPASTTLLIMNFAHTSGAPCSSEP